MFPSYWVMMASKGDAGSPGAPSACCNFMVPILEEPGGALLGLWMSAGAFG